MATEAKYTATSLQELAEKILTHAVSIADFAITESSVTPKTPSADTLSGTYAFIAVTEDGMHYAAWLYLPSFARPNATLSVNELGREIAESWSRMRVAECRTPGQDYEPQLLTPDELTEIRADAAGISYLYERKAPYDVGRLLDHIDALEKLRKQKRGGAEHDPTP